MHLDRIVAGEGGFVGRLHGDFAKLGRESGGNQSILYRRKIIGRGDDLDGTILVGDDIFGTGFNGGVHQCGFIGAGGEQHLPTMLEHERDRAVGAHVATVFGEGMTDLGDGAYLVVGQAIHHDGRAADAVAFVTDFFVIHAVELAGTTFDGVFDIVFRQRLRFGLVHRQPQARVGAGVTATHAGCDGDFLDQFGKDLAALSVLTALAMLNVGPFAVSSHGMSLCYLLESGNSSIRTCLVMSASSPIFLPIAKAGELELGLLSQLVNRHGLIAGATGTGKTVTLQRMAEKLSLAGVPVFLADAKGDLSGLGAAGVSSDKLKARLEKLGISDWQPCANPVTFWDVHGELGHPVRATVSDMGPLLLARLLNLNETQAGVLQLVFKVADDQGLLLLDLKDLRAMVQHVGENAAQFKTEYGNVSAASIGAIQRGLLALDEQGGDKFFGEPMLDIGDLMQTLDGKGVINVLAAEKLMNTPRLYACFLLWLLAELFEQLPEAGDLPKPKLVFFFDEAHLLFNEAPPALLEKIEQVVRLIRSKGVGVYFVTQNPLDIPDTVLGQLSNRVQHALRAFTPRDQKAVKTAAQTLRPNPKFDAEAAITELGVGEALISFLDEHGRPTVTERGFILAPGSRIGPLSVDERRSAMANSLVAGVYEAVVDRESAYEKLKGASAVEESRVDSGTTVVSTGPADAGGGLADMLFGKTGPRGGQRDGLVQAMAKSVVRTVGSQIGREIVRGVLGSILGGRRR